MAVVQVIKSVKNFLGEIYNFGLNFNPLYVGKAANGSDKDAAAVSDVNTPPAWAWADLQGWTGADIRGLERLEPDLELEGSHLGRGREFYDIEERRQYIVETLGVKAWHVEENTSRLGI